VQLKSRQQPAKLLGSWIPDIQRWGKIQNLFSDVIGTNSSLLDISGQRLVSVRDSVTTCSDLVSQIGAPRQATTDCSIRAHQKSIQRDDSSYKCLHGLHYFMFRIPSGQRELGVLVVGPLVVGKREDDTYYRQLCGKLDIGSEQFLDRIVEIKSFSYVGIRKIMEFLKELTGDYRCSATSFMEIVAGQTRFFLPHVLGATCRSFLDDCYKCCACRIRFCATRQQR